MCTPTISASFACSSGPPPAGLKLTGRVQDHLAQSKQCSSSAIVTLTLTPFSHAVSTDASGHKLLRARCGAACRLTSTSVCSAQCAPRQRRAAHRKGHCSGERTRCASAERSTNSRQQGAGDDDTRATESESQMSALITVRKSDLSADDATATDLCMLLVCFFSCCSR